MISQSSTFHGANGALGGRVANQGGGALTSLVTIGQTDVLQVGSGPVIYWQSGLAVDADGSPKAYNHVSALGLDNLANAGIPATPSHPARWWGLLTDSHGVALVQTAEDPAPGFYISTTALADDSRGWDDPRRFVDAESIPYIVIPHCLVGDLYPGDFALVVNQTNGRRVGAIVADVGPSNEIGEGSIALANALGVPSDPRTGGASGGILTIAFAGSRTNPKWPHSIIQINARVAGLVTQYQAQLPAL
jgi:hypothetical protein